MGGYLIEGKGSGGLLLVVTGVILGLLITELAPYAVFSSATSLAVLIVIAGALTIAGLAMISGNESLCSAAISTALAALNTFIQFPIKDPVAAAVIPLITFTPLRSYLGGRICKLR